MKGSIEEINKEVLFRKKDMKNIKVRLKNF